MELATGSVAMLPVDLGPGVVAGFTRRDPGCSRGPYRGLDLALHVGDDPEDVARNRGLLAGELGVPVYFARQVHGTRVLTLDDATAAGVDPRHRDLADTDGGADALLAVGAGRAVGVLVADCVPVLLADPQAGVVAAVHAGRAGLAAGVLQAAVTRLCRAGGRPERVEAALGPAVGGCCYEVPAPLRDEVAAVVPATWASTTWGTPALDLRAGCVQVLAGCGVTRTRQVGGCTVEDPQAYSYRRAQQTGRFAGVVAAVA